MGNIRGLSVEAGGTDNLRVNSTDENMEVLINAEQLSGLLVAWRVPRPGRGVVLEPAGTHRP
jgi:hypothetical protein